MGADVGGAATNIVWHAGDLERDLRWRALGGAGATIWMTGLSGSGKSTIASALEKSLVEQGRHAYRLDGDNVRHGLNRDLGFTAAERAENIRRIGEVARLFADSGTLAITSFISPYRADRDAVRKLHTAAGLSFLEIFVDTPLGVCEARDPKGLYARARAGEIEQFTGIDDPYEPPERADLVLDTSTQPLHECVAACRKLLIDRALLAGTDTRRDEDAETQ